MDRHWEGFALALQFCSKQDEFYLPEPNANITFFEAKGELWMGKTGRTRTGMLTVRLF